MGVNPTPSNFKTFTFDNTNSAQYGVYITGQGVFNAPERNVEMVEIPGRDGAYALDKGNFNNIEVTYPAGIVADTEADFATAVSNLRNFLCSKTGYCRLTDDYNTGEYRMAIYKSGLEVEHDGLKTGQFDLVFECKPQRFLTSGETKTTLTSGNAITNPTLFPSRPQLQVYGYGDIDIGGQEIMVSGNTPIGTVLLFSSRMYPQSTSESITIDTQYANSGDKIQLADTCRAGVTWVSYQANMNDDASASVSGNGDVLWDKKYGSTITFSVRSDSITFYYGTSSTVTVTATISIPTSNYGTLTGTVAFAIAYNGSNTITVTSTITNPNHWSLLTEGNSPSIHVGEIILRSTQYAIGNPIYIDLDIGEAYKIENGSVASVNNAVNIPAELPTLPSGATTITFDNTFTKIDIIPRWWKV